MNLTTHITRIECEWIRGSLWTTPEWLTSVGESVLG